MPGSLPRWDRPPAVESESSPRMDRAALEARIAEHAPPAPGLAKLGARQNSVPSAGGSPLRHSKNGVVNRESHIELGLGARSKEASIKTSEKPTPSVNVTWAWLVFSFTRVPATATGRSRFAAMAADRTRASFPDDDEVNRTEKVAGQERSICEDGGAPG